MAQFQHILAVCNQIKASGSQSCKNLSPLSTTKWLDEYEGKIYSVSLSQSLSYIESIYESMNASMYESETHCFSEWELIAAVSGLLFHISRLCMLLAQTSQLLEGWEHILGWLPASSAWHCWYELEHLKEFCIAQMYFSFYIHFTPWWWLHADLFLIQSFFWYIL